MPPKTDASKLGRSPRNADECSRAGGIWSNGVCVMKISLTLARGNPCQNQMWRIPPGDPARSVVHSLVSAARNNIRNK